MLLLYTLRNWGCDHRYFLETYGLLVGHGCCSYEEIANKHLLHVFRSVGVNTLARFRKGSNQRGSRGAMTEASTREMLRLTNG